MSGTVPGTRMLRQSPRTPSYGALPGRPPMNSGFSSPAPVNDMAANDDAAALKGPIAPVAISVLNPANSPHLFQSPVYQRPPPPSQIPPHMMGLGPGHYFQQHTPGQPPQHPSHGATGPQLPYIGTGARGVDWLSRISLALQCGIDSERDWALTALLEVSVRNPEALQFKLNSLMADVLLEYLNGSTVLAKDTVIPQSPSTLTLSDKENSALQKTLEAMLIIRNTSLDPENAHFLSNSAICCGLVQRGLALPMCPEYAELRSYCLDIVESISFHMTPESPENPLFQAVIRLVDECLDRGTAIPALRCLARFVIRDEHNIIGTVPHRIVSAVTRYLVLLDDEELISASLDFLYQYTARLPNIAKLLADEADRSVCTTHLTRLLSFKIERPKLEYVRLPRRTKKPAPAEPPKLTDWIVEELMKFEEPHRATHWIRALYENDPDGEVTQLSLWKSYEAQFEAYARQGRRLLPAVDFIKNVASAFRSSAAMVVHLPDGQKRFIIKGIRPREFAVAPSVLNAPKEMNNQSSNIQEREPSGVGITSALVLQNIARSAQGKQLLVPRISEFIEATLYNPSLPSYVDALLVIIETTGDTDEA